MLRPAADERLRGLHQGGQGAEVDAHFTQGLDHIRASHGRQARDQVRLRQAFCALRTVYVHLLQCDQKWRFWRHLAISGQKLVNKNAKFK